MHNCAQLESPLGPSIVCVASCGCVREGFAQAKTQGPPSLSVCPTMNTATAWLLQQPKLLQVQSDVCLGPVISPLSSLWLLCSQLVTLAWAHCRPLVSGGPSSNPACRNADIHNHAHRPMPTEPKCLCFVKTFWDGGGDVVLRDLGPGNGPSKHNGSEGRYKMVGGESTAAYTPNPTLPPPPVSPTPITMSQSSDSNTSSHHTRPSDSVAEILYVLKSFLGAATHLFDGTRMPDVLRIGTAITRLCLEALIIRALPPDNQRELAICINCYMQVCLYMSLYISAHPLTNARLLQLLSRTPMRSAVAAERATSSPEGHVQPAEPVASDPWVSRQGTAYYALWDQTVYHQTVMLHPAFARESEVDDKDEDIPDLVDLDD